MIIPATVATRIAVYVVEPQGFVRGTVHEGATISVEDARENVAATITLCRGVYRPLLMDMRGLRYIDREARQYYASAGQQDGWVSAVALLIGSGVSAMFGNLYLRVERPRVPNRLFTSEPEAIRWLMDQARAASVEARAP